MVGLNIGLITKKGIDKFGFVENQQIFHFFPNANIFDRDLKLIGYANYYPAFGSTIQFGQGKCIDFGGFGKLFDLFKSILSG